jgi:hypothetical protein
MIPNTDPLHPEAGADRIHSPQNILWHHAAFCRLALPLRSARESWQRDCGDASIRITPGSADEPLPSGKILRLILMFVCDTALRTETAVVSLGENAAALAARLDLEANTATARGLAEQIDRMLAAKVFVSLDGGPELSVFDARSRPRQSGADWHPSVRLNSRFQASLAEQAVPLDRGIVRALAASPAALDAYTWIRQVLQRQAPDQTATATWPDLLCRFGAPSQGIAVFRPNFEAALRLVFDADLSVALAVDDEGVSIRHAMPESPEPTASHTAPEPVPAAPAPPVPPVPALAPVESPPPPIPLPSEAPAGKAAATIPIEPAIERPEPPARRERPPSHPAQPLPEIIVPPETTVQDTISLRSHLTGLPQVIWLRRGHGEDNILVGVTPGARLDTDRLTILAVEPIVMQISGGLPQSDFERVSAWVMANRDLIDDFWEGGIVSSDEINRRVKKAPAPGWR